MLATTFKKLYLYTYKIFNVTFLRQQQPGKVVSKISSSVPNNTQKPEAEVENHQQKLLGHS